MKKRLMLFVHNVIAHPFMEWCYVFSFNGRIAWLSDLGERLHDATIDHPEPTATMTLMEFHEAARAIVERNGFGDYTTAVNANIWYHTHHKQPHPIFKFRVSMVSKANVAITIDEMHTPEAALLIFENELIRMNLRKSTDAVTDMTIA